MEATGGKSSLYNYPQALLKKAFEHLCTLGLVHVGEAKRGQANDQVGVRLGVHANIFHEFVKHNPRCPLDIQRFSESWLA